MESRKKMECRRNDNVKSQEAAFLDNINKMILKDDDFQFMHVPALAQRLEIYKKKFIEFDADGSGYLDYDEFKQMLLSIGAAKKDAACKKLFKKCRQTNRSVIYYRDFVDMILADTLRLGIIFNEEQDIVDKIRRKKMESKTYRSGPPSDVSSVYEEEQDEGADYEEDQNEDGENEEYNNVEDMNDDVQTIAESEYGESVLSYRSNNTNDQNEEEEVNEDVNENQKYREESEIGDDGTVVEEEEEEEPEEDEEEELEGEEEDNGEEVGEVKLASESNAIAHISRGVERVHLLRSEAPQGQAERYNPPSYNRVMTGENNAQSKLAKTRPSLTTNVQPISESYQSSAVVPSRSVRSTIPPPIVCTTRDLPPEATTKLPAPINRHVPASPYKYLCTDPACPDSYPKQQTYPLCTDPTCPYNRVQPQPPVQPQQLVRRQQPAVQYQPPVQSQSFAQNQPYLDYKPLPQIQNAHTCPRGHLCPSPPPRAEYVTMPNPVSAENYGYPMEMVYAVVPEPQQDMYRNQTESTYLPEMQPDYYYVVRE